MLVFRKVYYIVLPFLIDSPKSPISIW